MTRLIVAIVLVFGVLRSSNAALDIHEFADDRQRQRYHDLASVLRCPKCQNQSIAESSSPIANDLRGEIHLMLSEGRSDDQIIDFMVARYGDFVLYDPQLSSRTWLLWLSPGALLLVGVGVVAVIIISSKRRARPGASSVLSDAERHRLADLLQDSQRSIEQNS